MITSEVLTGFLGWCTVINFGVLLVTSVMLILARGSMSRTHGKMFGLDETDLARAYFQYLAQYKILALVFSVVPYVALRFTA